MSHARSRQATQPLAAQGIPGKAPGGRHLGRSWLAGCLVLAALFGAGALRPRGPRNPPPVASARSTHGAANRAIETIRVGQRVVTQDTFPRPPAEEDQRGGGNRNRR